MMSRAWFLVLGAAGLLAGCGKSEGGAAAAIPRSELPSRIASLLCGSLAGCCRSEGFAFDANACKSGYAAELDDDLIDYDPQRVVYDAQAAGDCLADAAAVAQCGEIEDEPPACELVFRGTVALGQPCTESIECKKSAGQRVTCTSEDGVSAEVCSVLAEGTALRHGKAGEACSTSCYESDACSSFPTSPGGPGAPAPATEPAACYRGDGLFCEQGVCAGLKQVGFPCTDYGSCAGDAFCDFNTQLCTAPRANGEPCEGGDECQSQHCEDSLASVADPGTGQIQQICASRSSVSAQQCANDFTPEPDPQPTAPAPSPGMP